MTVSIHLNVPHGHLVPRSLLTRALTGTLEGEGVHAGEVSVTFLTDRPIHDLNRKWLDHDWVPDVLSFALHDPGEPPVADIYVGVDQARRQASELGVTLEEELARLAVHGLLHVLGHDHSHPPDPEENAPFFALQEGYLRAALEGDPADSPGDT